MGWEILTRNGGKLGMGEMGWFYNVGMGNF